MIKRRKSISMAEAKKYIKKESGEEIVSFINTFTKISHKEAEKLREKLEKLEIVKINENHISTLIDFLPEDIHDLNKILTDTNLDENEAKKIIDTIKEFK